MRRREARRKFTAALLLTGLNRSQYKELRSAFFVLAYLAARSNPFVAEKSTFLFDRRQLFSMAGRGAVLAGVPSLAQAASTPAHTDESLASAGVLNVKAFGARGDAQTIDSPAINRAIEAAAAAGGGTVYFPADTYACYSIHLKSHVSSILSKAPQSLPLQRLSTAQPAAATTTPSRKAPGNPTRITAIITGTTASSGAKAFTISPSWGPG